MSRETDEAKRLAQKALDQLQDGITRVTIRDMCESIRILAVAVDNLRHELEGKAAAARADKPASTRVSKSGSSRRKA